MSLTFKKNKKRDIPFVSSSILNSFVGCKYRYWHEFIKNDGYNHYREDTDDESIYLTFGTIVHGSIENFWKVKRTKKNLINEYEKLLVENGFTDKSYIDLGYEMLDTFFSYLTDRAPKRKMLHSELGFKVNIDGVPLHGTIDNVFYLGKGVYQIVDYKTSRVMPTDDELAENIQLSLYDLVFSNEQMKPYWYNGIKPKAIILSLHFLRYDTILELEKSEYERENAIKYFKILYNQMRVLSDKQFRPNLNRLCTYCGCKDDCPVYQSVLDDTFKNDSKEEYQNYAEYNLRCYEDTKSRINILYSELDGYKNEVETYLSNNSEPLSLDGKEYFLKQGGKRYVKVNKAISILEKNNMFNPMDFITSIPVTKLDEIVQGNPEVKKKIDAFAIGYSHYKPSITSVKSKIISKKGKRK